MKLTKQQQDELRKQIELEVCRRDFYLFCVHMDSTFFTEGKPHLKLIADALQEVADGKLQKLAVSMPPRAGKSYITSLFCAWLLGKYPTGSIMRNSYAAKLAEKFSKDIRDGLIINPKYLEVFESVKGNGSIDSWSLTTNTQPSYFCAGVGGAITGFGCRTCLPSNELIHTNKGLVTIERLCQEEQENDIQVLTYNHINDTIRYNQILSSRRLTSNEIIEITTETGRKLRCTTSHRVWNGKEYVEAGLLQQGNKLYRTNVRMLRKDIQKTNVRTQEKNETRTINLLLNGMRSKGLFKKNKSNSSLSNMRECIRKTWNEVLFNRVQTNSTKETLCRESTKTNTTNKTKTFRYNVSSLQQGVQTKTRRNNILFKILRRQCTLKRNSRSKQPKLSRSKCSLKNATKNAISNKRQGQLEMLIMWCKRRFSYSSFRRETYAQCSEEFNYNMQSMPHKASSLTYDTIKTIKRIHGETIVYDIQVDKDCNFFASDFLVHNCAILDDPIKNIEEALSETVIESTWNWYTSTHLSRLETNCPEIHIATRWSRKDPIGRLTDEYSEAYNPNFKIINIPALNNKGESFCEEIKTTAEYMEIKKVTDEFIWEAEYMQHPVESKGLMFPIEVLKRFTIDELKGKQDGVIGFTDTADKGTDFLCSPVGRQYNDKVFITDVVFTQDGVEITEPLVAQQIIDTKCDVMIIESNNGGYGFTRNVRDLIKGKSSCSVTAENTSQNKETRIIMSAGYIKDHFYFRSDYEVGSMYDKFMRQLTSYIRLGKNKHDDAADALTGLAERVKNRIYEKPLTENEEHERDKYNKFVEDFTGGSMPKGW